ncbi:MAG: DUF3179 domain-containing protein [Pseudomonadota bacterium]
MFLTRRTALAGMAASSALPMAPTRALAEDDATATAIRDLLIASKSRYEAAITHIDQRRGDDLIAPLIFALRYTPNSEEPILALLHGMTGNHTARTWHEWMLWQEAHPEHVPHPAFIDMKRDVFLSIDPYFDVFLKPEHLKRERMKIRFEEIAWGGVRKDGIPSIDNPILVGADAPEAEYLLDTDLVFGVSINGDARAYPLRIMGWHEMFNDTIGGVPLAMAYCTLCGSGILFETGGIKGFEEPLVFGSSGFLYRSNKLMFDRQTHSLWNQFTGKPVSGDLVDSGIELKQRPIAIAPWKDWKEKNPETKVITLRTGFSRDYGSGVVYRDYFASPNLMFPAQVDESRLKQKEYVFGVRIFGGAKAWALKAFEGGRVLNDEVAGNPLVLIGNTAGRTVRAYERNNLRFTAGRNPEELIAEGDQIWTVKEETLVGPDGAKLPRVAGHIAYWFAWDGYLGAESEFFAG